MMPLAQQASAAGQPSLERGRDAVERAEASGSKEAFRYLDGERWVSLTWDETKTAAFEVAAGLLSLGLQTEDRVAIASGTRIEWILADLGIMCAGGATTTVYPTTQHEDVAFILADSESKVVFAEDDFQVAKVRGPPRRAVAWSRSSRSAARPTTSWCMSWDEFRDAGPGLPRRPPGRGRRRDRRHRPGQPGHADLHLGHHRPPQGRAAGPRRLDLRGHGDRGVRHHLPRRPAVPVAAAVATSSARR